MRIGTRQFVAGRHDLPSVLQVQAPRLSSHDNPIRTPSAQRADRIRLHQTLGGGFGSVPEVAAAAVPQALRGLS